jgi:hypothetical protein
MVIPFENLNMVCLRDEVLIFRCVPHIFSCFFFSLCVDVPDVEDDIAAQSSSSSEDNIDGNIQETVNHDAPVWEVGDFLVVKFAMEGNKSEKRYIGQILSIDSAGKVFQIECLRSKHTQKESGYIFTFPDVRDTNNFCDISQLYKLAPPVKSQRALKFSVRSDEL